MNPFKLFQRQSLHKSSVQSPAHMTWASRGLGRSITHTRRVLNRNLWIWPIVAVIILSIIGFGVRTAIESTIKDNLRSQLQTLLNAETAMLVKWFENQRVNAEMAANLMDFRQAIIPLLNKESGQNDTLDRSAETSIRKDLHRALMPAMSSQKYIGYFVSDRNELIVASSNPVLIGQRNVTQFERFIRRSIDGEIVVSVPFANVLAVKTDAGQLNAGEPSMFVCAPIRDERFQIVGVLALQLQPEKEFTQILQFGRVGKSGETYAFDVNGRMVSNSRFDEDLVLLGILADQPGSRSILNVMVRDPQGDMTLGYRPNRRRSDMPLTKMASSAIAGNADADVNGYRDYRGVQVVGAWKWLPLYEIGVATEMDVAEAFRALTILKRTFWGLYSLLVLSALAIFVFTLVVARLQRDARKATIEARQLGQYTLEDQLGAGAMGVVYKGHHAMLRRPTAIKLLDVEKVNDSSILRFEREVQITCKLNHPSTIQIYDYGRTPEGVFYYAMEYLDGINLQSLVEKYGPQPGGRVIHILKQACGSLFEAHSQSLVHRDIKPANMMLNRRGGEPDVIKVLDFGLVKAVDEQKEARQSSGGGLTGTPLYMSPESIQSPMSVDARSDLYSLGAVGYYLLTGTTVFEAESLVQLCQKHIDEVPDRPSTRLGKKVSSELENALLSCLEKTRSKRPQTSRDLAQMLAKCPEANQWTLENAESWWGSHERGHVPTAELPQANATMRAVYDQTLAVDSQ